MKSVWILFPAGALVLTALLTVPGAAQPGRRLESPSSRSLVTLVRIKPEMLGQWLDLQKNAVVPALKKLGVPARNVYTGSVFGDAFEYTIIQPMNKFADFDSPDLRAEALGSVPDPGVAGKLRKCIVNSSGFLSTALPDLSNPGDSPHPPIVQFLRLRVAPGKLEQYEALYRTEVLPALRKAGLPVLVASRRLGTDGYDLTFETPLNKFADLDAPPPLVRALGPEAVAKITAQLNSLATVVDNKILVREADLSY